MANNVTTTRNKWAKQIQYGKDVRCAICGIRFWPKKHPTLGPLTADHIIPKFLGGTNHRENLQPAHKLCNSRRGHVLMDEFKEALNQQNVLLHAIEIIDRNREPTIEELLAKCEEAL